MSDALFWKVMAIMTIIVAAYIGYGIHQLHDSAPSGGPHFLPRAHADGLMVIDEGRDAFITSGSDGRVIYLWEYRGLREPLFHAMATAK